LSIGRLQAVDLNADLGEVEGDLELLSFVTSASIACGFHAGDAVTMRAAVREALRHGVAIGAHPSYADREGFGRRALDTEAGQVVDEVVYQLGALEAMARLEGGSVRFLKLHGALYHRAATDAELAERLAGALAGTFAGTLAGALAGASGLAVLGQSGSALLRECERAGLRVATEAFCDRAYRSDGSLVPRSEAGAVLGVEGERADPSPAVAQALAIALRGRVPAADGGEVVATADSLCVHGDAPGALERARAVREALERNGVTVASFCPPQ
jgi:5-oxoprolinase (ATP-hydrolysing) subunit A